MFKSLFLLPALVATTLAWSVEPFDRIELNGCAHLELKPGTEAAVSVETGATAEVRGKTLFLEVDRSICPVPAAGEGPEIEVTYTKLEGLTINGAAKVETDGTLEFHHLELNINGRAEADLDLSGDTLQVALAGQPKVETDGEVRQQSVRVIGRGEYDGEDLKSRSTTVYVRGRGTATVDASKTLDITIDGQGLVRYKGSPTVTRSITGRGTIENVQ